jgi:hypothetical protein
VGSPGGNGAIRGSRPGTVSSAVRQGFTMRLSSQSSTTESTPRALFHGIRLFRMLNIQAVFSRHDKEDKEGRG